jgi:uncharacterized protein with gpF-like domain
MNAAARAVRQGAVSPADTIGAEHERRLTLILESMWMEAASSMAQHILGEERSWHWRIEQKNFPEVSATEVIDRVMIAWMVQQGGEKIKQITRTTQSDIQAIVSVGIREGLSERAIGQAIAAVAPTKSASRAQTIARTEAHSASGFAAQESAKATGLTMVKVWISAQGERTRPDHDEANGQQRALNEPFLVGDSLLMFPGDPDGPPEQIINCRCVSGYEVLD